MSFSEWSCERFLEVLSSREPTPGGGGAAALVGAIGTALGSMVGSLTLGKQKYADVQEDIAALMVRAEALRGELVCLMERDAEVFAPLSRAYGLPKGTEEERAEKRRVMAAALEACCAVPLEIMEKCGQAIDLHAEFAAKGTAIAISDVGCGVICCKAALQAASLNVFINTKSMEDRARAQAHNGAARALLARYTAKADEIFADVSARFE